MSTTGFADGHGNGKAFSSSRSFLNFAVREHCARNSKSNRLGLEACKAGGTRTGPLEKEEQMAATRLDAHMTWRPSLISHDRPIAISLPRVSCSRWSATVVARCSIVTFVFLALPACQPSAPTPEKLQVERSALTTPMFVYEASSVPQTPKPKPRRPPNRSLGGSRSHAVATVHHQLGIV